MLRASGGVSAQKNILFFFKYVYLAKSDHFSLAEKNVFLLFLQCRFFVLFLVPFALCQIWSPAPASLHFTHSRAVWDEAKAAVLQKHFLTRAPEERKEKTVRPR